MGGEEDWRKMADTHKMSSEQVKAAGVLKSIQFLFIFNYDITIIAFSCLYTTMVLDCDCIVITAIAEKM